MLLLSVVIGIWLTYRQQAHVRHHRHTVPELFSQRITLESHQNSADYTIAGLQLERIEILISALLLLAFTLGGGINYIISLWQPLQLNPPLTGLGFILTFVLVNHLFGLPLMLWRTFIIEQAFGFNRTTWLVFLLDQLKEIFVTTVLLSPLILMALWLMLNQQQWWFTVWILWVTFSLTLMWLYPAIIAPLFNKFKKLSDPELERRIEFLLQRCGFSSKGIYAMDGSRRSNHGNAYFAGLGRNKRIVFYDTLINSLNHDEIEAVLAHELGHFHHGHINKRLGMMMIGSLLGLMVLAWLSDQEWFYSGLGVSTHNVYTALILFMLCTPVFAFLFQPLLMFSSRRHEFQADTYAAHQADAQHLINALLKLYKDNATTLTPDSIYSSFHASHPPALTRIENLLSYKDQKKGRNNQ